MNRCNLKPGAKCQHVSYVSYHPVNARDCELLEFLPPKRELSKGYWSETPEVKKEMTLHARVKWEDDGTESEVVAEELTERDSEMERQFRKVAAEAGIRIQEKLNQAAQLIEEAEKISEETGVPFTASVSPLGQSYIPNSLAEKFPDLDTSFAYDVTEASSEYGYGGWEHSAVC